MNTVEHIFSIGQLGSPFIFTNYHNFTGFFPVSRLKRSLGEAGEIEPETEGILMSYDVDYAEFSDEVRFLF